MNLLRSGLLMRKTGNRRRTELRGIRILMRFFSRVHNTL